MAPIEDDEVKAPEFQMHLDKSLGQDGMSLGFHQKHWAIVDIDVIKKVRDFWDRESFEPYLTFMNIVLVPKKKFQFLC